MYNTNIIIFFTFIFAFILYFFHWKFELPLHPNVDEAITVDRVEKLLEGNGFLIRIFNYPHLAFYWGGLWCKVVSIFTDSISMVLNWIWVDCFTKIPIGKKEYDELKMLGYRLCFVSPELEGRQEDIKKYVTWLEEQGMKMDAFEIRKDYNLDIMRERQTLTIITTSALEKMDLVLCEAEPDIVLVHGDGEGGESLWGWACQ